MKNSELNIATQLASGFTRLFTYKITRIDEINNEMQGKYRLKAFFKGNESGTIILDPHVDAYLKKSNEGYDIYSLIVRAQIDKKIREINKKYPKYEHVISDIHIVDRGATFQLKRIPRVSLEDIWYGTSSIRAY